MDKNYDCLDYKLPEMMYLMNSQLHKINDLTLIMKKIR